MQRVQDVLEILLARHVKETLRRCSTCGAKDAPYVACAPAVDAAIGTQGKSLAKECGVSSITTEQLRAQYPP